VKAGDCKINGLTLVLTCGACPEQYDVFDGMQMRSPTDNEFAHVLLSVRKSPLRWRVIQWFRHQRYRLEMRLRRRPATSGRGALTRLNPKLLK
jgi:hypothetical protein